jgi:uronate dehydrogenase
MKRKVLITGAAGRIGTKVIPLLTQSFDLLLADNNIEKLKGLAEKGYATTSLDILNQEECIKVCNEIDTIIHLAGNPSPKASFAELKGVNMEGVYNIFTAAKSEGVKRVVLASSIHAIKAYTEERQVKTDMPTYPLDLYGVSKVFDEVLANYFAYQEGIEAIAIRIGGFDSIHQSYEKGEKVTKQQMTSYISPNDMAHLLERCVLASLRHPFMIAHGISDNAFKFMDLSDTKEILGYSPKDDAFKEMGFTFK